MWTNLAKFFCALSLLQFSFATRQQILKNSDNGPFNDEFAQLAAETLHLWNVPGLSIAVVDGDDMWAEGYGIAKFPDTRVTPSTLFYAGSTTKAFTAAAMSFLVDDNEKYHHVKWDTPISQLIRDDFVLENDYATTHTTIEDALSHRSGLPRHDTSYGGYYDGHKATVKDAVRSLRYLPLTAEPRTRFQYSNLMFVVASHVIETLTGTWLGDFLLDRIWEPLDMKSTYFSTFAAKAAPEFLAQGYVYHNNKYHEVPYMDLGLASGAGSVVSNVLDYSKWAKAFMNSSGPISKAGYKALKTSRTLIDTDSENSPNTGPDSYSLGWHKGVYKGYEFLEHSGGMEAFGADVLLFPALKYGLVTFGNTAITANAAEERLIWHLVDEKLRIPEKERFDRNKKNQAALQGLMQQYENAVNISYPDIPTPPISPSLPLLNYTGTYYHPGYQNMTFTLKDDRLHADRTDYTWKMVLDLKHVSADYFMAYQDSTTAPKSLFRAAFPAEFKIGSDGIPTAFGIACEEEMGPEGRIWFTRV